MAEVLFRNTVPNFKINIAKFLAVFKNKIARLAIAIISSRYQPASSCGREGHEFPVGSHRIVVLAAVVLFCFESRSRQILPELCTPSQVNIQPRPSSDYPSLVVVSQRIKDRRCSVDVRSLTPYTPIRDRQIHASLCACLLVEPAHSYLLETKRIIIWIRASLRSVEHEM